MFGFPTLATLLLAASSVSAHATFQDLWINGVDQGTSCVRPPASNSPVTSVTSDDLTCNVNGNIAAAGTCAVKAGDTIAVEMHQQPGDRDCATEAIGGAHYGPTIIYMAKVDDVATTTPWTAGWFKVNNTGLIVNNPQYWGTDDMNANCGKVWFKVPSDIAPGNYLVRAEVIALHVAGSVGGAQFYMSCYQLTVSGSGTASPSTVSFPGAYSATDPGILINIYTTLSTYIIPGPTVYSGGAGGAQPTSTVGSSSTAKPTSTTVTTTTANPTSTTATTKTTSATTKTTSTTATSTATGVASQYQQCGGTGYTGPTTCASPFTCTAVSPPYYYQCL